MQMGQTGTLFVVATPIGNLDDMVPRAVRTLQRVKLIACEDTRHSAKLLNHFQIDTPVMAYHDHSDRRAQEKLLSLLEDGKDAALISDAGTPLISDPGFKLIRAVRDAGYRVCPIPGACAVVAALCASGLPTDRFLFAGFLPAKAAGRRQALRDLASQSATLVFYEAPHRVLNTIRDLAAELGEERRMVLAREISKAFETFLEGSVAEMLRAVELDSNQQRGEIVLLVQGATEKQVEEVARQDEILKLLLEELPVKKAASLTARITGGNRNQLYDRGLRLLGN